MDVHKIKSLPPYMNMKQNDIVSYINVVVVDNIDGDVEDVEGK